MTRIGRRKAPLERFYDNALYEIATGVTIMEKKMFSEKDGFRHFRFLLVVTKKQRMGHKIALRRLLVR